MNLLITAFIIPSILLINLGNSQQEQSYTITMENTWDANFGWITNIFYGVLF